MKNNKMKTIHDFGQSIWLDYFDRKIMDSGELQKLIDEDCISGVTSNPSIFEAAISASKDYDDDIATLGEKEKDNSKIFFKLAVKDIQRAAGFFSKLYDQSDGKDGFVSIEVSPSLAYNTEGTIKQAIELWKDIDRENVMIKIPATSQGLPAIRKCVSEGINVNVTLLFGLHRYKEVADAYLSGLEDRVKSNKSIDNVTSVASFFVSRIDAITDPLLEDRKLLNLKGKVAIASAKKAYEQYKNVFNAERFTKLAQKGAKTQRLLWASTGTKDPSYSDVKYVESLIGPDTINTVPQKTLAAFNNHGNPANNLALDLHEATAVLTNLNSRGIDIDIITQKLEDQGIEQFNKAYNKLLKAIEQKKGYRHTFKMSA